MEFVKDIVLDALVDSLKLLPFLFISYLVIELFEHKASNKIKNTLSKSNKLGSFFGALFGVIPQCGFSVTASTLFSSGLISIGTLVAVFISTSDEAIPVILSSPQNAFKIIPIIIIKVCFAVLMGFFIDFVLQKNKKTNKSEIEEHMHEVCSNCNCEENIFLSVLKHTLSVFIYVLVFSIILNGIIELIGEENLSKILLSGNVFQPIIAGIIGLIPNCAASILLSSLYIDGTISLASIITGLSVGSGVGLIVLFKENKNIKQNLKIMFLTFSSSVIFGILLEIIEVILHG